jgi:leucyl-tRNA synthetase
LVADGAGSPPELDRWLESGMHALVRDVRLGIEGRRLREVAGVVYGGVPALVRRYLTRGGTTGPTLEKLALAWIRLLAPVTPHLAEELGAGRFPGLVSLAPFPSPDDFAQDERADAAEAFLDRVEDDLRPIVRMATERRDPPEGVVFFVADPWKDQVERWAREALANDPKSLPVGAVLGRAAGHPELAAHRAEIAKYVTRVAPALRSEPGPAPAVDELGTLRAAEGYLARRFALGAVTVLREREGAEHDPAGRRERARPGRPAFFLYGASGPRPGPVRRPES